MVAALPPLSAGKSQSTGLHRARELSKKDDPGQYATGVMDDGTRLLIDRRAAARLPSRIGLTVGGLGRLKHLDLDLEGEQWGTLLYD
jgi:hypothetical protein